MDLKFPILFGVAQVTYVCVTNKSVKKLLQKDAGYRGVYICCKASGARETGSRSPLSHTHSRAHSHAHKHTRSSRSLSHTLTRAHTCTHTHTDLSHTLTHAHTHMDTHTHTHVCIGAERREIRVCVCACIRVHTCVYIRTYTCTHALIGAERRAEPERRDAGAYAHAHSHRDV